VTITFTYTQLGVIAVVLVVLVDLFVARTRLVTRRAFWVAYAIMLFFQFITNGMFTGFGIVRYNGDAIIGSTSPSQGPPPFIGDGRLFFAPVEDVLFGFALIMLALIGWVWWGRRGVQATPLAGPPMWRRRTVRPGRSEVCGAKQPGGGLEPREPRPAQQRQDDGA
jgi:lycopene cyclase domain-containing protein